MHSYMRKDILGNRLAMQYIRDYRNGDVSENNGGFKTLIVSPGAKEILTMRIDANRFEAFRQLLSRIDETRFVRVHDPLFFQTTKIMDLPYYETLQEHNIFASSSFNPTELALFGQLNQSIENFDDYRTFKFPRESSPSRMHFNYFLQSTYHFIRDNIHHFFRDFPDARLIPISNPAFFDKNHLLRTGALIAPGDLGKLHHDSWNIRERHRFNKTIPVHQRRLNLNYPEYFYHLSRAQPFHFDDDHLSYYFYNRVFAYPFVALIDSTTRLEHIITPYGDAADNYDITTTQYRISCRPTFAVGTHKKKVDYYFKDYMFLTPASHLLATKKVREQYLHFLNKALPFVFEFTPFDELFPPQLHQIEAHLPKANISFV